MKTLSAKARDLRFPSVATLVIAMAAFTLRLSAGTHYQLLHSFGALRVDAQEPRSALLLASDGWLYGTTFQGGDSRLGMIFKLNPNGTGYAALHEFTGSPLDGSMLTLGALYALPALLEGSDGAIYGVAPGGGAKDAGVVFRMSKDGSGYRLLHSFGLDVQDGSGPFAALVEGSDGALYGTTQGGGQFRANDNQGGTVFTLNKDGSNYRILHSFSSNAADGAIPSAPLVEGSDGALYGTTESGGANRATQWGTVFKVNKDGSGYRILRSLSPHGGDGFDPGPLSLGSDGVLYGTTASGPVGANDSIGSGTVFRLNQDGTGYRTLRGFQPQDASLILGVVEGRDQNLYGAAASDLLFKLAKDGSGYAVLHRFDGSNPIGGWNLAAGLVAQNGTLFGTTAAGGGTDAGTVFRLNQDGSGYRVIHGFNNRDADGLLPEAALIEGSDGAFYGTTTRGGRYLGLYGRAGTVFRMSKDGRTYSVLHNFMASPDDGQIPVAGLLQASDGGLYGTTTSGGANGDGVIFKIAKDQSSYRILHEFGDSRGDGFDPETGLIEGRDGLLYGCAQGGAKGGGALFKLQKDGSGYRILFDFDAGGGGSQSPASLVEGQDGRLYGVAKFGSLTVSTNQGAGTVFGVNKDGTDYRVLAQPRFPTGLIEGTDGVLYGVSVDIAFKVAKDGTGYSTLHRFSPLVPTSILEGRDGALYGIAGRTPLDGEEVIAFRMKKDGTGYTTFYTFPARPRSFYASTLVQGTDRAFYGTTYNAGDTGEGAVFRLSPPQTPDLLNVLVVSGMPSVGVAGTANEQYQIVRSTDLLEWNRISTFTMPVPGSQTVVDSSPPPGGAYYRALWLPP